MQYIKISDRNRGEFIDFLSKMDRHPTWTQDLFPDTQLGAELEKFAFAVLLGLVIFFIGRLASKKISTGEEVKKNLIPEKKFSLFAFFDIFCEGFIKFHDSVLGKENRRHFPLSASVFIFILFSNLLGLVPQMAAITTTVWVNVGIALVVFIAFNYCGIKEHGIVSYLKHFAGGSTVLEFKRGSFGLVLQSLFLILCIAPALFAVEILSTLLRVLTLNLRLYWNISADHSVLSVFNEMLGIKGGFIFYGLGTFVSFMQAFIFTVLTMVYILLATQHEEEH